MKTILALIPTVLRKENSTKSMLVVLSIFLVFLPSCTLPAGPGAPGGLASEYMPLTVGNQWYYASYQSQGPTGSPQETGLLEVVGELMIGDMRFQVLTYSALRRGLDSIEVLDTLYYRTSGSQLFRCILRNGIPNILLIAEFSLSHGQSYTQIDEQNVKTSVTVTRHTDDEMTFLYDAPEAVDDVYRRTFKKGVGIVDEYSPDWGIGSQLTRAVTK
jgi:hypothetical protein